MVARLCREEAQQTFREVNNDDDFLPLHHVTDWRHLKELFAALAITFDLNESLLKALDHLIWDGRLLDNSTFPFSVSPQARRKVAQVDSSFRYSKASPWRCHRDPTESRDCLHEGIPWFESKGKRLHQIFSFSNYPRLFSNTCVIETSGSSSGKKLGNDRGVPASTAAMRYFRSSGRLWIPPK